GCGDARSREYAIDLGIALQLTNILRDLKSDAARGRIYVPLDEIAACGYSEEELVKGARTPAFVELMRRQAARARGHFESSARLLPEPDRKHLLAAEVMRAIYLKLLRRIERSEFRVFEGRISVPRLQQLSVALRAWVSGTLLAMTTGTGKSPDAIVVGGGFAGLAAATHLAQDGARLLLLEARPHLGGRARSWVDPDTGSVVDNGQHLFMGCYRETLRFLERIGSLDRLHLEPRLRVPLLDPGSGMSVFAL